MNGSWNRSICVFNEKVWDTIFKEDILKSYSLIKAVENSKLPNVEHYYLDIKRGDEIVGILPCFTFSISLEILMTKTFKKNRSVSSKLLSPLHEVGYFLCWNTNSYL